MAGIGSRWGQADQFNTLLGNPRNATFPDVDARSNLWALGGFSGALDQATAATKKGVLAAIPVQEGDVISKVSVLVGATEGKTGVKSFVVIYSGTTGKVEASLLGQSKVAEVAIKPKLILTETLEKPITITSTNAPNGYVFAGLIVEATAINTEIGVAVKAAAQKAWFTATPEVLAVEVEQKEAGVAEPKLKTEAAVETVPFVILT